MPLPTMATPLSRNGASALPTEMWTAGSRSRCSDSITTGIFASGSMIRNGTNTPWSKPRSEFSSISMPAAAMRRLTSAAIAGAPGAGYFS